MRPSLAPASETILSRAATSLWRWSRTDPLTGVVVIQSGLLEIGSRSACLVAIRWRADGRCGASSNIGSRQWRLGRGRRRRPLLCGENAEQDGLATPDRKQLCVILIGMKTQTVEGGLSAYAVGAVTAELMGVVRGLKDSIGSRDALQHVTTGPWDPLFHRNHRVQGTTPMIPRRFFARADSA